MGEVTFGRGEVKCENLHGKRERQSRGSSCGEESYQNFFWDLYVVDGVFDNFSKTGYHRFGSGHPRSYGPLSGVRTNFNVSTIIFIL